MRPVLGQCELEDFFDVSQYREAFKNEFGVDPSVKLPAAKGKKWSDAMQERFMASGKKWDKFVEMNVKLWLARWVEENPSDSVHPTKTGPIDNFADTLLEKLGAP